MNVALPVFSKASWYVHTLVMSELLKKAHAVQHMAYVDIIISLTIAAWP